MSLGRSLRNIGVSEILLGVFLLVGLGLFFRVQLLDLQEDITYALDPSPQLAYAYGERHFDAQYQGEYDIARAEHFFLLAAAQDQDLPYLYHELARISFLNGDFTVALAQINYQIALHGDSEPNSYYVRGLIEGYMGQYAVAAEDYKHYIQFDPQDWAAMNDYAWVLLKAGQAQEAVYVTERGLQLFPGNSWLLNTNTVALYENGDLSVAEKQAAAAVAASKTLTVAQWLTAYPGNDPAVASEGIVSLQNSAEQNMHTVEVAIASSTVQ